MVVKGAQHCGVQPCAIDVHGITAGWCNWCDAAKAALFCSGTAMTSALYVLKKGHLLLANPSYAEVKRHYFKSSDTMGWLGCAQSGGDSSCPLSHQSMTLWGWDPRKGFQCHKFLSLANLPMFPTTAIVGKQFLSFLLTCYPDTTGWCEGFFVHF